MQTTNARLCFDVGSIDKYVHRNIPLKQDLEQDLEQERYARAMLEERVAQLECRQATKENTNDVTEEVDKSIAVMGGFAETTVEETEEFAHDLLKHLHGFRWLTAIQLWALFN